MNEIDTRSRESARAPLVAMVLPSLGLGGAEIVNIAIARELIRNDVRVDMVLGWEEKGPQLVLPESVRRIVLGALRTRGIVLPLAKYLRERSPDAVVVSLWPFTTACLLAHRLAKSPSRIGVWEHNTLSKQYDKFGAISRFVLRKSIAFTCRGADVRIAVSNGVADDLAELSGFPRTKFSVVYNPLLDRSDALCDVAPAEALWRGWQGPRILTVGSFKAQKNHALLLHAFKRFLNAQDARLLILGDGPLVSETTTLAQALGIADKVFFPGSVSDPTPYYGSANLFVLSSDYEGFGNVIVEALANGLPVVSTDCSSGPAEILENGRYGRLTPVGDADALAMAMVEQLGTIHDREALKRRAADFAPEVIARQFKELLLPAHLRLRSGG